jgi:hypothetical protein
MTGYRQQLVYRRVPAFIALAMLVLPIASVAANPAGTGFFVTPDGYFLTCLKVVEGARRVTLKTLDGHAVDATVVAVDRSADLAVLKAGGKFSPLALAGEARVRNGASVLTLAISELDAPVPNPKLAKGTINIPNGKANGSDRIHVAVPIQPGNCGGPLVTPDGNVVGVITMRPGAPKPPVAAPVVRKAAHAVRSSRALALLNGIRDARNKLAKPASSPLTGDPELALMLENATAVVIVDTDRLNEEEQDLEREQAERIRRAIRKEALQRAEIARKLDAERARQREIGRLQSLISNLEREESSLHSEVLSTEQRLLFMPREGATLSDLALRGEMENRLAYLRAQLHQKTTSKQAAMKQLNELRLR